jgi:RHS repeat-associated protein
MKNQRRNMKKSLRQWMLFLSLALAFLAPREAFATGACTCARFNDFYDCGCHKTPGVAGGPASGALNPGGDNAYCPTCQSASGMPRWWVDEPYINLHVMDDPLSYTTSSGQEMAFRFTYKQRFALPGLDQIPSTIIPAYVPGNRFGYDHYVTSMHNFAVYGGMTNAVWSHNWMTHVVFWDWNWEAVHEGSGYGGTPESFAFQSFYEALVFDPDGGTGYYTYAPFSGSPIDGETLNSPTQTNDPVSQAQLLPLNLYLFTTNSTNYAPQPDANGIYWGGTNGFKIVYPDGSQDLFTLRGSGPVSLDYTTSDALLTQRIDPQGRATLLGYKCITNNFGINDTAVLFLLSYVVDPDGRTNTLVYTGSTTDPWVLQEIDDPFGRKATFNYTNTSWLNGITDAAGNTNLFVYTNSPATSGWLHSLTTSYGTTAFSYYQQMDSVNTSNYVERVALVNEPQGANQLFAYIHNLSGTIEATDVSPLVPGVAFDDGTTGGGDNALYHRNSFHWDREQFANLSGTPRTTGPLTTYLGQADFQKATLKHWLIGTDGISVTETLSSTRDPSPDSGGAIMGARTWYGYTNSTTCTDTNVTSEVSAIAQLLPDGTPQYTIYNYDYTPPFTGHPFGIPTSYVSSNAQSFSESDGSVGALTTWFHYTNSHVDLYSVSNSIGQFEGRGYNASHQVTSITNALGQVTVLGYDSSTHNLIATTNYSGQSINYTYNNGSAGSNDAGFLYSVTVQPEGLTQTIADYTYGQPRVVQLSGTGLATLLVSNTWDKLNRLTGTLFPDGTTISNIYASLDLVAHLDRLGHPTHFVYDNLQHLIYVTNALNNVTAFTWCNCGALTSITDPLLTNTTYLNYDNQGRLTNVNCPDGSSVTKQYDLFGRLTNQFDGAGKSFTFAYNNQGLLTAISNLNGQVMGIGYDAANRPITVTNADGVVWTKIYDLLNRVTTNAWPDGSAEYFQYSTNGLISYENQDGQFTYFGRDGAGRVTALTDNLRHSNVFSYDALDHVISLTDGLGHNTFWNYNQYGWMTNKLNNLNASVLTNGFDANGQLTTRWMPATGITTYKWDAVGNLTNIAYPARTDAYTYDADNRLTGMADTNGTDVLLSSFTYTRVGQLATETGPWASNTLTYTYNQGHRASLSLNSQIPTINQTYGYDSAWRLQSLAATAGTFAYGYTPASASSLVRTVGLPNAASIVDNYDSLARLDYTALLNYWGHPLDGYAYISDSWGLRTNITRQLGLSTNIVTNSFDGIGQLMTWSGRETNGTLRQNEQLAYGYDAAGNLHVRNNGLLAQTFTVDTLNQLSNVTRTGTFTVTGATPAPAASVTVNTVSAQTYSDFTFASTNTTLGNGNNTFTIIARNMSNVTVTNSLTINMPTNVTFQYDSNGNLTNDGTRWFFCDADNQLTNVTTANRCQVVFVYDGLNRRRIERDYTWTNSAWLKTHETRFLYDGMQIVQERDTNNDPLVTYTRGLDLTMSLSGAGGIGGMLARTDANGSTFYHADGAGNITALMDGNQNIVARAEYDAFGKFIKLSGSLANSNRYWFSSKEYVPQAGLFYYGARFYEPNFQRWLNRDPIAERGGINLYAFVGNDPEDYYDYLGFGWWQDWQDWADHAGQSLYGSLSGLDFTGLLKIDDNNPYMTGGMVIGMIGGVFEGGTEEKLGIKGLKMACNREKEIKRVRDAESAINKAKDLKKAQDKAKEIRPSIKEPGDWEDAKSRPKQNTINRTDRSDQRAKNFWPDE